jgi:hypothetical protein
MAEVRVFRIFQWHMNCSLIRTIDRMATRMNMMKLLQEVRGLADFPSRRAPNRPNGPLALQATRLSVFKTKGAKKRWIQVTMMDAEDIPCPVVIQHRAIPSRVSQTL